MRNQQPLSGKQALVQLASQVERIIVIQAAGAKGAGQAVAGDSLKQRQSLEQTNRVAISGS